MMHVLLLLAEEVEGDRVERVGSQLVVPHQDQQQIKLLTRLPTSKTSRKQISQIFLSGEIFLRAYINARTIHTHYNKHTQSLPVCPRSLINFI
mgnify:CR=1 FL=1